MIDPTAAVLVLTFSFIAAVHSFWSSCGISVAESLLPPLSGATKRVTAAVLVASATVSGALLGFVVGLPAEISGVSMSADVVAVMGAVAIGADVVFHRTGRARPLGLHKQVPVTWARVFHPVVAGGLYGARLGIGPLTIPTTWLWWTALVAGGLQGVWISVAVGATYGLVKNAIIAGVGLRYGSTMPTAMGRLREREWPARRVLLILAAIPIGLVGVASCTPSDDDDTAAATSEVGDDTETTTTTDVEPTSTTTTIAVPDARTVADVVLNDVPSGFTLDTDPTVTGSFDITTAANIESDPMQERTTLETRGFVSGYSRGWSNVDDDTITVVVYDFATAEGATAYLGDGKSIVIGRGGSFFEVPEVPNALGFSYFLPATASDVPFTTHSVTFARSNRWYLVVTGGRTELANPTAESSELVRKLANDQRALVEGA